MFRSKHFLANQKMLFWRDIFDWDMLAKYIISVETGYFFQLSFLFFQGPFSSFSDVVKYCFGWRVDVGSMFGDHWSGAAGRSWRRDREKERQTRVTAAGGERQWLPFKHRLRGGGHATARGTTGWKGDVDRDCGPRPSEKEFEASLKWLFFAFEGDGSHGRKGARVSQS